MPSTSPTKTQVWRSHSLWSSRPLAPEMHEGSGGAFQRTLRGLCRSDRQAETCATTLNSLPVGRRREFRYNATQTRRDGRVAEGGGLLNRYRVKSSIGGSNPPLSASLSSKFL